MKRSWPSLIGGTLIAVLLISYMITFQVRFSEVGVVRTFGQIGERGVLTEPGLYWKWPWPIQKVDTYDARIQTSTTMGEETPTRDGKNVIVSTTICWRIEDPYIFSIRCKSMADAEERVKIRVRNDQKTVISNYDFTHFVSTNPNQLRFDQIEAELAEAVQEVTKELYGVRIERVAIESLALPEAISTTVIDAMKKEREAIAQRYTSEGESQAQQIKETAESIAGTILSFADRKAKEIIAEGQARSVQYNKVFSQDEALAVFLLQIENIPKILSERATLILDQPIFTDLFRESPSAPGPLADRASSESVEGTLEDKEVTTTIVGSP